MILILDQKKDCSRDWTIGNIMSLGRKREFKYTADMSSFVAVKLSDGSGYYIFKNRSGESGYTVKGELALNQLISENLKY